MDIKVGDLVLLKPVTVLDAWTNKVEGFWAKTDTQETYYYRKGDIEKILPRPFAVGDKVRFDKSSETLTIIFIHGEYAWIDKPSDGKPWTVHLSSLVHA